jgi:hypothetical protein
MGKKAIREFNPQWIVNIPELGTHQTLLKAMETRRDIRHRVFQTAQALESIALIPSTQVALRCLALWWREAKKEIYQHWHDKLREQYGTDTMFNEMFGCLRNVYQNMRVKAGAKARPSGLTKGFVERKYREL